MMYRTAITLAALVILVGCARSVPEAPVRTAVVPVPTATTAPVPTPTAEPEPTPVPVPTIEIVKEVPLEDTGLASLEENIVWADVIARVQLSSVESAVEQRVSGASYYAPALVFTFDVLEYLKGTGGTQVKAVAYAFDKMFSLTTEEAARPFLPDLLADRDTRWDRREAVVFMAKTSMLPSTLNEANRYLMGATHYIGGDAYTVASKSYRSWLPDADPSPTGGAKRQSSEQSFLLADPDATSPTRKFAGPVVVGDTITLTALKSLIGTIAAEIAAGDGSDAYRQCVLTKYRLSRAAQEGRLQQDNHVVSMPSGAPSGYVLHSYGYGWGTPPDNYGRHWTSGADQDLFSVNASNPRTNTPDSILYDIDTVALRPLTAGAYRFTTHELPGTRMLCELISDAERLKGDDFTVKVVPPDGTALEALFDPAAVQDSVTAASTSRLYIGSGSPVSTAIGAIRWAVGRLSLNLAPARSFAGLHLDFIAQDGTLALTVAVTTPPRLATRSHGRSRSCWGAGDKMMVRLYQVEPHKVWQKFNSRGGR